MGGGGLGSEATPDTRGSSGVSVKAHGRASGKVPFFRGGQYMSTGQVLPLLVVQTMVKAPKIAETTPGVV